MIRASRISVAVAPLLALAGVRGEVLACHRSALNLVLGDRLIAVVPDAVGGLPDGINVGPSFSPAALGILPGMTVAGDGLSLLIGKGPAIDLRGAAPWSPVLRSVPVAAPGLRIRAVAVRAAASADGRAFGLRGPASTFPAAAAALIRDLTAALGAGNEDTAAIGARLIGLGPGLTPSGDDLLVGLAAALLALGDARAPGLATTWAAAAATRTTPVAASFHRHAAAGEFAERLHDLLAAVLAGPVEGIASSVERAAVWGATSGADTVLGVSLALDAVARAADRRSVQHAEWAAA